MTYGQTGAGKTFTMVGGTQNYKHRGVIPRAINHIFSTVQSKPENEYTIKISYDLLSLHHFA
jgi:kinesin family protein 6/9